MEIIDSIITNLTFAVLPVDDFTGKNPLGKIRVYINELNYEGIINKSGYHLFLDLQDKLLENGNIFIIKSVEQYYQEKSKIFSKDDITTNNRVFQENLIPSVSYPFSHNETLIKGTIMTEISTNDETFLKPIYGANVKLRANNLEAITDNKGGFVFYFKNLREDDIVVEDEKKFIKMGTTHIFDLLITSTGYNPLTVSNCKAEMYKTTVIRTEPLEKI